MTRTELKALFSIQYDTRFSPHPGEAEVAGERACVQKQCDVGTIPVSFLLWEVFPRELQFSPGNCGFPLGTAVFPWELRFSPQLKYH